MPSKPRTFFASPDGISRLNAAKARLNLTSAAIAKLAGVSADTVGRFLRGKRVSEASVEAIATVLNLQLADIVAVEPEQSDEALTEAERRIQTATFSKATVLDLSGLNLTTVPESVGNLNALTQLFLYQNQLTKIPDSLGNLSNLTELFLSQNQLTTIPDSLGKLSNLTYLDLSQNQLTTIPNSLGKLSHLTELFLSQNHLTTVPDNLGNLSNLTRLDLDQNQLTTIPDSLGNLTNLIRLALDQNQLTTLPDSLEHLDNLTQLFLFANQLTSLPDSLGNLSNLTQLFVDQNQLTSLPNSLGNLRNLTQLFVDQNQLTSLPNSLGNLRNLTQLFVDQNQLTTLPESLGNLSNLTQLDLDQNQLMTLPESLGNLSNLTALHLSENQLTTLPESLGNLGNLTELYLYQNQLTTLPESLGNLSNLTELSLSQNQLTTLPESLGNLSNLTELSLCQNQLTTLPGSLGNLSNLIELSLCQNQLTILPESLGNLSNLTQLCLANNHLTVVPEFISQLINLQRIDLNDNQLTALSKGLEQLPELKALLLHGNTRLGISNEVLGPTFEAVNDGARPANPQDILNYYFRVLGDRQPLNEAKLILVGFGNVGKTSLVNRLVYQTFNPDSKKTEGIQITQWPMRLHTTEEITLHVWDFGGQEIMHSTHQFFLTERSLYVLVLNGRQGHEDADSEYWLELIQSFGGDSPIIVVLNKVNEHPFDVNRSALKQKFPAICEFIATDCADNRGFDQLQATIERETDRLEHLRDAFPTSWIAIKNRLANMADNYISFDKYRDICQQNGELDHGAQNSLAVHLHSLGIALNYKNDPRLRDTHVLNPHWVTSGIYKLLNAHDPAAAKGELDITSLTDLLDCHTYPPERHSFLLELMRKFELCFPFPEDEHRYLIPDLLDKQQPAAATDFNPDECLNFRYEYPILPEGLLPRFIVRTQVLSTQQLRWRTGVILEFEGNRALVKGDRQDRSVTISINGTLANRRRLLAIIRYDFDRIHSGFKFKPPEKVPVPQHPKISVDYKELVTREEHKQTSFDVFTGDGLLTLNVRDLLNGVDLEGRRKSTSVGDRQNRPLQLFYSYSHRDEGLRDELEIRLKLLERNGLIQSWHDRRITPGIEWQQELDQQLEQADIILLLISPDFIASDYCYEIEMTRALQRHKTGEAIVIPILLRSVDWTSTSFSYLQALPTDLKPVTKWSDTDDAWHTIEQGIKHVIQGRQPR